MNTFATIGFVGVSRVRYARFYIKTGEEELTDYPPLTYIAVEIEKTKADTMKCSCGQCSKTSKMSNRSQIKFYPYDISKK